MSKVTLDDVDYETDNFTEEQNTMLGELKFNNTIQEQLGYEMSSLKTVASIIIQRLKNSLIVEIDDNKEDA
tara:strand:+ start:283 stop:495 length:213 start_codon:yes stop_codon:yes gene_type:complete